MKIILAKKLGMTQVFDEKNGYAITATILDVSLWPHD